MTILTSALVVTIVLLAFVMLPWVIKGVQDYTQWFLVAGTATLLSIALFELLPEMVEEGGLFSVVIMVGVWAFFSAIHWWDGRNRVENSHRGHSVGMLVTSLGLHSFSSGMLLVSSYSISDSLVQSVFLSLVIHKAFEGLSVSSMLIARVSNRLQLIKLTIGYASMFPLGVLTTSLAQDVFGASFSHSALSKAAIIITSIALGSLLGCLLHDFVIPAFRSIRRAVG